MKYLLFVSTLMLFTINSYAGELLKCLAQEEALYHKRKNQKSGPYYKLNQTIISEVIQLPESVSLSSRDENKICNALLSDRSIFFLKMINLDANKLKTSKVRTEEPNRYAIDMMAIDHLHNKSFSILLKFVLDIQKLAKDPNCIYKKIPQLKDFMNKARYIEEDIGIKKIFNGIKNKRRFYKNIYSSKILEGC